MKYPNRYAPVSQPVVHRSLFGRFKRFYSSFCDGWMRSHPGRSIDIYEVTELAGSAIIKAFNPSNIISAFRNTGIFPYNEEIFTDDMFLPASVTDISPPVPADEAVNDGVSSESSSSSIQSSSSNETVLTTIMLHTKSSATARCNSRQQKSSIITDEGEKRK